ncbi:MAG: ribosome biogenesis GTPase Der [Planctomycetota bacterium]
MPVPCVAIVGRPNVGKSTLFNALLRRQVAITEPTRGVTRDRVSGLVEPEDGPTFELIDTGGIGVADPDGLSADVERQIQVALDLADVILFLTDVRDGVLPDDARIAERLHGMGKPVFLAVNKVESPRDEAAVVEFYQLGFDPLHPVSAVQRRGCADLLDAIVAALPERPEPEAEPVAMRLAIVGRRNVGKSTLVNAIAGEDRVIVSETPGTTRDAVDVRFEKDGKSFIAIDTAGVRKKRKVDSSIEFYSLVRARRSIRDADVVLLLLDVTSDIVEMDRRLAREIADHTKPCVIVVNKWDLAKQTIHTSDYMAYLEQTLPVLDYAPVTFITAKTGRRVMPTIELAQQLFKQAHCRAPTNAVNRALREAVRLRTPPPRHGRVARFYYATQVAVAPPTIVVFCNDPNLVAPSYRRYLADALRDRLPFPEVPIRLLLRARTRRDRDAAAR